MLVLPQTVGVYVQVSYTLGVSDCLLDCPLCVAYLSTVSDRLADLSAELGCTVCTSGFCGNTMLGIIINFRDLFKDNL